MTGKLRVLMVHNYYQQSGGEDVVFEAEKTLLCKHGHEVIEYVDHNERVKKNNPLSAAAHTIWSKTSYQSLLALMRKTRPDVAHFHNTFFMVSPSAYFACNHLGIPVIQTLHNYRLLCPSALFLRGSSICEECLAMNMKLPSVRYACYRDSRLQSAVVAALLFTHHFLQTWDKKVNAYIALNSFAKNKFIEGGISAGKIHIKPNFVEDIKVQNRSAGDYALFLGRLSKEKGLLALLTAWERLPDISLRVVGTGPLQHEVMKSSLNQQNILSPGNCEHEAVYGLMAASRFMVIPSIWFEGLPMSFIEACTLGVPVLASRVGAMTELIQDGKTGLLFNPGDPQDLASKARWLWDHPEECMRMGQNARQEYEEKYTPEANYIRLLEIYEAAIESKRR